MAAKTIVILGGGVDRLVLANELRRLVRSEPRIVLIEKTADTRSHLLFSGS
jgi:NADH dehydrogenase FAD-containing subunit